MIINSVKKLPLSFPHLFIKNGETHPAFYGVSCHDGWYSLLKTAFEAIDKHLDITENNEFQITCVKEKFGGLRIYANGTDDFIDGIIRITENMANITCEYCGST